MEVVYCWVGAVKQNFPFSEVPCQVHLKFQLYQVGELIIQLLLLCRKADEHLTSDWFLALIFAEFLTHVHIIDFNTVLFRCHIISQFNQGFYDYIIATDEQGLENPTTPVKKEAEKDKKKKKKATGKGGQ